MDGSFGTDGFGRTGQADLHPATTEREWSLSASQVAVAVVAIVAACWLFASLG